MPGILENLRQRRKEGQVKKGMATAERTGYWCIRNECQPSELPNHFLELVVAEEILGEVFDLSAGEVEEMIGHRMAERPAA